MTLDTVKMHRDILIRLEKINKPQRYLTKKLGISRATFWRLSQDHEMKTNTFLKLVQWLEKPIDYYIINIKNKPKTSIPDINEDVKTVKLRIHKTLVDCEIPKDLVDKIKEKHPNKEIKVSFDTAFCLADLEDDESVCWGDGEHFVFVLK